MFFVRKFCWTATASVCAAVPRYRWVSKQAVAAGSALVSGPRSSNTCLRASRSRLWESPASYRGWLTAASFKACLIHADRLNHSRRCRRKNYARDIHLRTKLSFGSMLSIRGIVNKSGQQIGAMLPESRRFPWKITMVFFKQQSLLTLLLANFFTSKSLKHCDLADDTHMEKTTTYF